MNKSAAADQQSDALAELARRVAAIESVFDTEDLLTRGRAQLDIIAYYTQSAWGYRRLHSREGAIHMALNPDGEFDRRGLVGQAGLVESFLGPDTRRVLELGSGYGFNVRHLAARHPDAEFVGVDLVRRQVAFARRRSAGIPNATYQVGDFQQLQLPDGSIDAVYSIESFCHATDLTTALAEAWRVLRNSGLLIIVDAWRTDDFSTQPELVRRAAAYVETAMAVGHPRQLASWQATAQAAGFRLTVDQDLTSQIMPNLRRFESMAGRYLRHRSLARLGRKLLPERLIANAVAGYLTPLTVALGAHTYRLQTLTKISAAG